MICYKCGGSGVICVGYTNETYVSHDMALDAGDPDLECMIYQYSQPIFGTCPQCNRTLPERPEDKA